jgi:hypothetical protein
MAYDVLSMTCIPIKCGAKVPYQPWSNPLNVGFQRSKVKVTTGGRNFGPMLKYRENYFTG